MLHPGYLNAGSPRLQRVEFTVPTVPPFTLQRSFGDLLTRHNRRSLRNRADSWRSIATPMVFAQPCATASCSPVGKTRPDPARIHLQCARPINGVRVNGVSRNLRHSRTSILWVAGLDHNGLLRVVGLFREGAPRAKCKINDVTADVLLDIASFVAIRRRRGAQRMNAASCDGKHI